ncbi:MAG: UDP-N-acetylmuramate--L-alanine ligase [Microbacterium sp.]|mgnify:FL=1|uniref:UDP-N-acetylmuramate--L-alanine ligase n=1 Tax=unclassified Microbacterium TaxID=2609290 RepID=UPI000C526FE6|nr:MULTISPECIES: UDP-N-acetylmuramate--L-alanine ligase [unclassified Microbacterium]MAY48734.1 UDP-N-acetylmuramate--L-alanine ligase [Microbacterium sp.]HAS32164.1 UDP-N-acetylmuramate--L-alanine ligase [Microbacterium sp.]HBR88010.1 UDP-N-acetylmuramate--L-alanine ligase [Microbacterium sp.]HBS75079.1 UDP-N-acetylmuramate--L-alanine ligase [Microbacterium sp.]|tara:strand:+ start:9215 stop:10630 length:1416 start_codon:yes stop_codon:yes gene_type:complete
MIRPDLSLPIPERIEAAHFIGIGGSGMSGLARMFLQRGIRVSGSDRADSAALRELAELGATVHVGHDAANLADDVDTVVHTGAIWAENPEFLLAKERGLHVIHRSQALYWLIGGRRLVSVAGAHGKTTSTGMIVTALRDLGDDPTFVNGGVIAQLGASSGMGADDLVVIEADESDGTFLLYETSIALITNIDADHLDHYGTADAFDDAFARFADAAREAVVISADDRGARRVRERMTHENVVTFGVSDDADVRLVDLRTDGPVSFAVEHAGERVDVRLPIPGAHNALNATGAMAVLLSLGWRLDSAARAVGGFTGTVRRFELHGVERGVSVFDDYAHHPTEVAAALAAARTVIGDGRIIALHQPHTYSRTQAMFREFAEVLESHADHTVVLDVYGAREDPVPGVTGELVADAFEQSDRVAFVRDWQDAADYTASVARAGDYIITLGCGNVYLIIPQVLEALAGTTDAPAGK